MYGDRWEENLEREALVRKVCVTEMITHIYNVSKAEFTKNNNTEHWWFYHDALKLMTADATVAWMKAKGYYMHWLLPELNILYNIKECKHWRHIMPGNTPGSNPLDMQCFHDVNSRVNELI